MRDWKGIAQASGLAIPPANLERTAASLEALEKVTAPLYQKLAAEQEPASVFVWREDER